MPELPEVETTRRGIAPYVEGQIVQAVEVREPRLRWPVPPQLPQQLQGQRIDRIHRRGKYLLFETPAGSALLHLGMSGSVRVLHQSQLPGLHDHVDIQLINGSLLRYNDPRRFGCLLWLSPGAAHPLLDHLGPEPLTDAFHGELLYHRSRGRRSAVKRFIMDGRIVVGVGNIYANEALFMAGIRPDRAAGRISQVRYSVLADAIKEVLTLSIERGGTTLRDFVGGDGKPGYFAQQLNVYGRGGAPCPGCGRVLREFKIEQRSTVCCVTCQR